MPTHTRIQTSRSSNVKPKIGVRPEQNFTFSISDDLPKQKRSRTKVKMNIQETMENIHISNHNSRDNRDKEKCANSNDKEVSVKNEAPFDEHGIPFDERETDFLLNDLEELDSFLQATDDIKISSSLPDEVEIVHEPKKATSITVSRRRLELSKQRLTNILSVTKEIKKDGNISEEPILADTDLESCAGSSKSEDDDPSKSGHSTKNPASSTLQKVDGHVLFEI
jgi:hypothetical protein